MKLTDFLQDVGRPVAYYPELRRITGSVTATILLCQFIYWRGKESDQNGWLYKTADDIQEETGLSYGEQKTARRDLIAAGLLDEHYARLDHQMRFKVNLEAINEKWGIAETSIPESGKPQFGNDAKPLSLNESEITAENTTQDDNSQPARQEPDKVLEWLKMGQFAGAKREMRIDAILSYLGERFHVNTEVKKWKDFAKFVETRQTHHGEQVDVFVSWLLGQKDFNLQYWPPSKMQEFWPMAFVKVEDKSRMEGKSSGYFA